MMQKKILIPIMVTFILVAFIAGAMTTYQRNQIMARESFSYSNPVIIDMYKVNADPQMVANGWTYLGQNAQGRYHYQWIGHNHIINGGQNWQNSLITGLGGAGKIVYIALSTGTYGSQADTSLQGGELGSGLARTQAQATLINAAGSGSITFTLINTFTYTGAAIQSNVQLAGLFTSSPIGTGTLWAETTFADLVNLIVYRSETVNLSSGDTLTINYVGASHVGRAWTITSGGS